MVISAKFDEPIDPGTVSESSFQLYDNQTGQLSGMYSVSADGRMVMFTADAPLAVGRGHYAIVNSGITDLSGNTLSGSSTNFTTQFSSDTVAPLVVDVSPSDTLAGVAINARVVVEFNEPVQQTSTETVILLSDGTLVDVSRSLSNGNRTLTLVPVSPLAANTLHTINIEGVLDIAGNALAAQSTTFTTESGSDFIRPTLVAVSPPYNATDVATNVVIQLEFSERLSEATVNDSSLYLEFYNTTVLVPTSVSG